MSSFVWKPDYSVSVDSLDNQHKKLINLLNSLNEAMLEGKGKQILDQIVSELLLYSEVHFQNEEKLFGEYAYPDSAQHIALHDEFRRKVNEIKEKKDSGNLLVTVDLLNFLYSWVEQHILKVDKKYSDYFTAKGLI